MQEKFPRLIVILSDIIVIFVSFLASMYIRFGLFATLKTGSLAINFIFLTLLLMGIFYLKGLYNIRVFNKQKKHFYDVFSSITIALVLFTLVQFFTKSFFIIQSRLVIVLLGIIQICLYSIIRVLLLPRIFNYLYRTGILRSKNVLIVSSDTANFKNFENFFNHNLFLGLKPVGGYRNQEELEKLISEDNIAEILLDSRSDNFIDLGEEIRAYTKLQRKLTIKSKLLDEIPDSFPGMWGEINKDNLILFKNKQKPLFKRVLTRLLDLSVASVSLIVLSPLFLLVAVLIKLTSKGPVFFKQTRIGYKGNTFTFYKFRSMRGSDDSKERAKQFENYVNHKHSQSINGKKTVKVVNENRITSVGRFLRKLSIDELPQLINILKGEMSVVGPRPSLPYEVEHYKPWHKSRFEVKPGLTGTWQVYGRSSSLFNVAMFMDYYYVHNSSMHLDIKLIFKTFPVIFGGIGGY